MSKWCTREYLDKLDNDAKNELIFQVISANEKLTRDINDLKELLKLKSALPFMPSTEKIAYLFDEMELLTTALTEEEEKIIEVKEHTRTKAPHRIKELDSDTPIVKVDHCENADDEIINKDGYLYTRTEDKIVDKIAIVPAKYYIERHHYPQYKLKNFEADKSLGEKNIIVKWDNKDTDTIVAASSLVARIATRKYNDQLPLYRQEAIFKREGLEFTRQTLSNWLLRYFNLIKPLRDRLKYHILTSNLINQDETALQVLRLPDSKPTAKHYMMVQVGVSNLDANNNHKVALFTFLPNRTTALLNKQVEGYTGYIMTDGLKGYDHLKKHFNCWVHAVRQFKAILKINKKSVDALIMVNLVKELYKLEKKLRDQYQSGKITKEEFNDIRKKEAKDIFIKIDSAMKKMKPKYTSKSAMGKALNYIETYWKTLIKYPECFESTPDNNVAENACRPFAVGRRNWLFSVSQDGADASALYYSLVETAKINNINSFKYIWHVLEKAPVAKSEEDWDNLLPWNVGKEELLSLEENYKKAKPNENRIEKYIFRGYH